MCVCSMIFSQALLQLKPFSGFPPANYRQLFRAQSLAFASRGNLPIAAWEMEGPFRASPQQPASLLPASGPRHAAGRLGTRSGTPVRPESAQSACLLHLLRLPGWAGARSAAPVHEPCQQRRKKPLASPSDTSPQSPRYGSTHQPAPKAPQSRQQPLPQGGGTPQAGGSQPAGEEGAAASKLN